MNEYSKPNFLVVGAAKSGTTSLFNYLRKHPEVFIPERKECRYFSNIGEKTLNPLTGKKHTEVITSKEDYYNLFEGVDSKARGDISPDYLFYYKETIKNVKSELGNDVKIIILLRNPVDRAYSNYMHLVRENFIPSDMDIEDILEREEKWLTEDVWWGFFLKQPGFYYGPVKNYLQEFSNVKVFLFDDYINETTEILKEICHFLCIDKSFKFSEPSFTNKTGYVRSQLLDNFLSNSYLFKKLLKKGLSFLVPPDKLRDIASNIKEKNLNKPELDNKIRQRLINDYNQDVRMLEDLIAEDLSNWKN